MFNYETTVVSIVLMLQQHIDFKDPDHLYYLVDEILKLLKNREEYWKRKNGKHT